MAWSEIKHALNSTLGTSNFKSLNELLEDYVSTGGNIKCVKSVQRGNATFTSESANKTVTISRVNLSKSILILTGGYTSRDTASSLSFSGHLYSSTQLYLYCDTFSSAVEHMLSWQVVEFY